MIDIVIVVVVGLIAAGLICVFWTPPSEFTSEPIAKDKELPNEGPYRTSVATNEVAVPDKLCIPLLVTEYANLYDPYTCPRCGKNWTVQSAHEVFRIGPPMYCTCEYCDVGHFHVKCEGITAPGCKATWIMKARS